jgi:predicted enzyme related to lactoylglutathione lyase
MISLLANIDVPDLETAIEFYRDGLGLRLGRRLLGGTVAEMLGASSPIYLLAKASGSAAGSAIAAARDYRRHWTPVHIDFAVENVASVVRQARAAGATLEGVIQKYPWGRLATMSDPFGHGFCLVQFTGRGYGDAA